MKKFLKWFSILAAAGTAIGLVIAYFCKSSADSGDGDGSEFTEDEDFDLDADLQPTGREYVSLKKEDAASSEDTDEEGSEDTSDDETESADEE